MKKIIADKSYEVELTYDRRHPTTLRPETNKKQWYSINAKDTGEAIMLASARLLKSNKDNHANIKSAKAVERKF